MQMQGILDQLYVLFGRQIAKTKDLKTQNMELEKKIQELQKEKQHLELQKELLEAKMENQKMNQAIHAQCLTTERETQTQKVESEMKGTQMTLAHTGNAEKSEIWEVSKSKLYRDRKKKAREAKEMEEEELIQQLEEQVVASPKWKRTLVKTRKDTQEMMTPAEAVKWLEHLGLPLP